MRWRSEIWDFDAFSKYFMDIDGYRDWFGNPLTAFMVASIYVIVSISIVFALRKQMLNLIKKINESS